MTIQDDIDKNLRQRIVDEEHLRLLRIGYFVSAATTAFASFFGLLYGFVGLFVIARMSGPVPAAGSESPEVVGWMLGLFGLGFAAIAVVIAAAKAYTGQCLKNRRSRALCLAVATFTCLGIPYGTLLGVWTFMVLNRPTVAAVFDRNPS